MCVSVCLRVIAPVRARPALFKVLVAVLMMIVFNRCNESDVEESPEGQL
jgi:hypothetical protein